MVLYPDVQQKVRAEIDEYIGGREVVYKDRLNMPYTEAVLTEVLRIGNISPTGLPRTLHKELILDGKVIPAGADLIFDFSSVIHDKECFPEPLEFKPERFLSENGSTLKRRITPFGLGQRACLGEALARMEIFLFFTTLIQKYRLSYPENEKPSEDPVVMIVRAPQRYNIVFERR